MATTPANSLALTDSKFSVYPYWPPGKPCPVDSEGWYRYLPAQLNVAQIPKREVYPDKGLLQFYLFHPVLSARGMAATFVCRPCNKALGLGSLHHQTITQ